MLYYCRDTLKCCFAQTYMCFTTALLLLYYALLLQGHIEMLLRANSDVAPRGMVPGVCVWVCVSVSVCVCVFVCACACVCGVCARARVPAVTKEKNRKSKRCAGFSEEQPVAYYQ